MEYLTESSCWMDTSYSIVTINRLKLQPGRLLPRGLSVTRLMDMEATCTVPSLCLEVEIKNGPMSAKNSACVAVIYRPYHAISEFRSRHTNLALMIGGDFNADITTRDSDKLRENMRLGGLLWQETGPTR